MPPGAKIKSAALAYILSGSELSTGHFSWTRPAIADKKSDPTHLLQFNIQVVNRENIQLLQDLLYTKSNIAEKQSIRM